MMYSKVCLCVAEQVAIATTTFILMIHLSLSSSLILTIKCNDKKNI